MGKLKSIILFCRKVSFLTSPNDNLFQDQKFDDNKNNTLVCCCYINWSKDKTFDDNHNA